MFNEDHASGVRARPMQALGVALGSPVVEARRVRQGDARRTVRLALADGRAFAARRFDGPDAAAMAARLARRTELFARAGIPVPWPMEVRQVADTTAWVTSPWFDGPTGAAMLNDPERCRELASAMGAIAGKVAAIDRRGIDADDTWADPERLARAVNEWTAAIGPGVDAEGAAGAVAIIERAVSDRSLGIAAQPAVAHGDLVPVNVIVRPDGRLVLVDLVDVHVAPRLVDLAWWGWVVRYHHPDAWAAGWPALLAAAGIERDPAIDEACAAMGWLRALERAAAAPAGRLRARWQGRVRETAAW
jgi:aminoglycoside phosphotransferase